MMDMGVFSSILRFVPASFRQVKSQVSTVNGRFTSPRPLSQRFGSDVM